MINTVEYVSMDFFKSKQDITVLFYLVKTEVEVIPYFR